MKNLSEKYHYGVYSVFDVKAKVYDVPFYSRDDIFAERKFRQDVKDRENSPMLAGFKDDFELHRLGLFYPGKGNFVEDYKFIIGGKEI